MLIDSHAHLNFDEYKDELGDVIQRSFNCNTQIITVGSNFATSQKAITIAEQHQGIWAVIGCHPIHFIKEIEEKAVFNGQEVSFTAPKEIFDYQKYYNLAKSSPKVVGIGEVGLDFFRLADSQYPIERIKEIQTANFKNFIELAMELDLPLVLHCRGEEKKPFEAYDLMLDILETELNKGGGQADGSTKLTMTASPGVIHCFGGTLEQARKFIDLGFYIGFTGIVTFKNARDLQGIVKEIPLNRILVETDAPFLAPEPYRGQRNEPAYVRYVAQKIAELKNIPFIEVEKISYNNTVKLFKL
jgi:TatD DNase family protein